MAALIATHNLALAKRMHRLVLDGGRLQGNQPRQRFSLARRLRAAIAGARPKTHACGNAALTRRSFCRRLAKTFTPPPDPMSPSPSVRGRASLVRAAPGSTDWWESHEMHRCTLLLLP